MTTSCLQYSLNSSHFSGACFGRFQLLPPLLFVGLQGVQKYRIKAFPVESFCLSCGRPIAFPVASNPAVYPQYSPWIIVQFHCSKGVRYPAVFKQYHSNAALYACLTTLGFIRAVKIRSGIRSSPVRSTSCTSSSSYL